MEKGRSGGQKSRSDKYEIVLEAVMNPMSPDVECTICCSQDCRQWLNMLPSWHCNNTVLSEHEFHQSLLLGYQCTPADLPKECDGCSIV
eukprot:5499484-Ditylum_brightwellii.AAC.1